MVDTLSLLEQELPNYISEVKEKHSENAKAIAFSSFIQKVFQIESKDLDFEVPVKTKVMEMRGRIDAVFGNLIIEFKKDLKRGTEEAEDELKKYFQSYHEKFPKMNYLGMASDGLQFRVYHPIYENDQVTEVKSVDQIDLETKNAQDVFLWFDSYLFSTEKIIPTSDDIRRRFGVDSPTYNSTKLALLSLFSEIGEKSRVRIKYKNWQKYLEIVYGDEQKEIDLFIKHTYLSTLVKLLVHLRLSGGKIIEKKEMSSILHGFIFRGYGILNFVEEDFFTWITYLPTRKTSDEFVFKLLSQLKVYDLEKIDEDILKELYQELIDPEYRKLLGEFYTPDWLAQMTTDEILNEIPEASVLDPSCGSGTFLFTAIRYKIKHLGKKFPQENDLLNHILSTVRGFDLHPLAVTIAKTNYLLALRSLINFKREPIEIPVYLADSVKLPSQKASLFAQHHVYEIEATKDKSFLIPSTLATKPKVMDDVIQKMYNHASNFSDSRETYLKIQEERNTNMKDSIDRARENFFKGFQNSIKDFKDENITSTLISNYQTLISLIDEDVDSIWTYIIKNIYKPIALTESKVDVIIGNPPWITMQNMKNELYQQFLKKETFKYGLLDKSETHQFPHIELATLFFCMVSDLYLKENGKIGFVMPKSIFFSSHHEKFRKFEKPLFHLEKILDAEHVAPLFKVPCCVILCKRGTKTTYPVSIDSITGKLEHKNASIEEAMKTLSVKKSTFEPVLISTKQSPYFEKFSQGATIVPRNFFFVDIVKDSFLGINPISPKVKSDERNETKLPWSNVILEGEMESIFLYGSLLGADIVPFGNKGLRLVVLPITVSDGKPHVCKNHNELREMGYTNAARYFELTENYWTKYATDKAKIIPIYQWLNYRNKIENQNLNKKYKVLYVASATYLASCVIDMTQKTSYSAGGIEIPLNGFIAESKTYYFETDNLDEAYYLSAILNSKTIDLLIKPLQTHGLWGERDIHKRPLLLPIPQFSRDNQQHMELSRLGNECHLKVPKILSAVKSKSIGSIRSQIRKLLEEDMQKIDSLTKEIIK